MVMKNLIRRILKEDANIKVLNKHVTRDLQKQVDSGKVPMLDFLDFERKGLSNYFDEIKQIYFDFVGDEEEAFKLFKSFIDNKDITEKDIESIGIRVHPDEKYRIKITGIYNPDYRGSRVIGSNTILEFGFALLGGQFTTNQGVLSLEELYGEEYDEIWTDVTDNLKWEIEDYVLSQARNFGLEFDDTEIYWND
jgi:hypothetical protein